MTSKTIKKNKQGKEKDVKGNTRALIICDKRLNVTIAEMEPLRGTNYGKMRLASNIVKR